MSPTDARNLLNRYTNAVIACHDRFSAEHNATRAAVQQEVLAALTATKTAEVS